MGILDDLFGPDEEESRKAYGEGVKDRDKADLLDHIVHSFGDELDEDFHWRSKKEQSHDAGWHDRGGGKVDWERIDPDSTSTSSANSSSTYSSDSYEGSDRPSETKGCANTVGTIIGYMIAIPIYLVIGIFVLIFVIWVLLMVFIMIIAAVKSLTGT